MRGYTQLSAFVHLRGADLHFKHAAFGANKGSVQGLIAVGLGIGDVVVKFGENRLPQIMNDAEHAVTFFFAGDFHPHRAHIIDLRKFQIFSLHFLIDTIDVLDPAIDFFRHYACLAQLMFQQGNDALDITLAINATLFQFERKLLINIGFQSLQGAVFQLPFELGDT